MSDPERRAEGGRSARLRRLVWQFVRFLIVGGISFAVDFGIYFLLITYADVQYVLASTISFSISLVLNYVLTLRFVFEAREGRNHAKEFALYVGLNIIAVGLNQLILFLTVDTLGASPVVGKIVATAVVLVYNFISRKLLIERSGTPRGGRDRPIQDGTSEADGGIA